MDLSSSQILLLIPMALLPIATWHFSRFMKRRALAINGKPWPKTRGTILRTGEIIDGQPGYDVILDYAYVVDGQRLVGRDIRWRRSNGYATRQEAEAAVAHYFKGREIDVFYEPDRPARGWLEGGRRKTSGSVFWWVIAIWLELLLASQWTTLHWP